MSKAGTSTPDRQTRQLQRHAIEVGKLYIVVAKNCLLLFTDYTFKVGLRKSLHWERIIENNKKQRWVKV
jgi:hypothetical protein